MSTSQQTPTRSERRAAARAEREARERAAARARRGQRLWLLGGVVAAAAAVVVVAIVVSGGGGSSRTLKPGQPPAGAAEVAARFRGIPEQGINLGSPRAPVTLVEYADLKCPICREYTLSVFPRLVDRYVRTGKLRIAVRLQTFVGEQFAPGDSERAARFALAAGQQGKLWPFAELFYINQQDETTSYVSDAFLRKLGGAVPGLDVNRALAQRDSAAVGSQLALADSLFTSNGFSGTPSFQLGRTGQTPRVLNPASFTDPAQFTRPIDALLGK